MNSLIVAALILDKRPQYTDKKVDNDISILVAAYNEQDVITETLESIIKQDYSGTVNVFVINDGSTDNTEAKALSWIRETTYDADNYRIKVLNMPKNSGKSAALNLALKEVDTDYTITIDADTYLYKDALNNIVANITHGPKNTAAVAGTTLIRNSRKNFLTKLQEWDYFLGISVVKRTQSLFQGTLVAQGAFSIYRTNILRDIHGWNEDVIGEDIVMTWSLRAKKYRIGYAENAFSFTNAPQTYKQFFKQRERWSRGLIEAFKIHPKVLTNFQKNSPFIYINFLFPVTDLFFLFVFVPGIIAAVFFQYYAVVGIMTLFLLPLAVIISWIMFSKQVNIFHLYRLKVRRNFIGFLVYMLAYQFLMVPATVFGYWGEIFGIGSRSWGTK
jgi:biofilm PGA synthesis N-glycosyltransferase PgaC